MELRTALSVCLISLFSATLVVLIARSLDSQAAARLEPQLERIAEQLENLDASGGSPRTAVGGVPGDTSHARLVVYYFHGSVRCPTCRSIESQAYDAVCTYFADQLDRGEIVWKTLDYESPSNAHFQQQFGLQTAVVVLASMKDGQIERWQRLDEVWGLVDDKPAFANNLREKIKQCLSVTSETEVPQSTDNVPDIPLPDISS